MYLLDITHKEMIAVLSAVSACNRTGGGSSTNTLLCKLQDQLELTADPEVALKLQAVAHEEYIDQEDELIKMPSPGMMSESDCFGEVP